MLKRKNYEGREKSPSPEKKIRLYDSYQDSDRRLRATKNALDRLLEPDKMQLDSRERRIYEQTKVELEILNKGEYAINALRSLEDAFCAARRAHLKALIQPGEFPDSQMQAWKPGGEWAKVAENPTWYEQEVKKSQEDHQTLEMECPIFMVKRAINSKKLNNAISYYDIRNMRWELEHCKNLRTQLGKIWNYHEGTLIGIGVAEPVWQWIKMLHNNERSLGVIDLSDELGLRHHRLPEPIRSDNRSATSGNQRTEKAHIRYFENRTLFGALLGKYREIKDTLFDFGTKYNQLKQKQKLEEKEIKEFKEKADYIQARARFAHLLLKEIRERYAAGKFDKESKIGAENNLNTLRNCYRQFESLVKQVNTTWPDLSIELWDLPDHTRQVD